MPDLPASPTGHNSLKLLDYSILQQCMHCGFCLPTCPTYVATRLEKNSPRGRIALMRGIADGALEVTRSFGEEMYFCLGCLACVTACPAGVDYARLFETARADIERSGVLQNPSRDWTRRGLLGQLFTRPRLLRLVGRALWIYQAAGLQALVRGLGLTRVLPKRLRELERQTPRIEARFSHELIPRVLKPAGTPVHRVGLLTGCVQDLAFATINRDTAEVLVRNGCEVYTPPVQFCCGSLHAHNGEPGLARGLARRNLDLFPVTELDAIITNAAGCGSHLKTYGHLLADDADYAERAREWSSKVRDVSEWLVATGWKTPKLPPNTGENPKRRITYHEACHLCHGQKVSRQPRDILRSLPGVHLCELPEATWCCGSAGIYNLTQPEMSRALQERKVKHILGTGAEVVAAGNPGCHLQLINGLRGHPVDVQHPVSLLAAAYRAEGKVSG
ncbi:MAG TPA: heterodisulfide reductase-related iron-sulfur binding cluster [Chthoniobacterales bacterium]